MDKETSCATAIRLLALVSSDQTGFLLKGNCLFRGEEKASDSQADPMLELKDKTQEMDLWPFKYILGESHGYYKLIK